MSPRKVFMSVKRYPLKKNSLPIRISRWRHSKLPQGIKLHLQYESLSPTTQSWRSRQGLDKCLPHVVLRGMHFPKHPIKLSNPYLRPVLGKAIRPRIFWVSVPRYPFDDTRSTRNSFVECYAQRSWCDKVAMHLRDLDFTFLVLSSWYRFLLILAIFSAYISITNHTRTSCIFALLCTYKFEIFL